MKRKILVLLLFLLFLPFEGLNNNNYIADTNAPISSNTGGLGKVWEIEKIGNSGESIVVQGGFIYTFGETNGYLYDYNRDPIVIKWDLNGTLIWEKVFDDSLFRDRTIYDFSGDGEGFYVTGYQPGDKQGFLVKINQLGDIVWDIELNSTRLSLFSSEETILAGGYGSIAEINSTNGAVIKQYYFPEEYGFSNYLLFESEGDIYSVSRYLNEEHFLIKHNSTGDILWNVSIGTAGMRDIWVNESLYLLSTTRLLRWSLEGDILWNVTSSGSLYRKLVVDEDGFYIVGSTDDYTTDLLLTRRNLEGGFVWEKSWRTKDPGDQSLYDAVFGGNNTLYTLGSESEIVLTKWIKDETAPTIPHWADMNYEQSDTTSLLYWSVYDENPDSYTISVNDSIIEFGNWTSGTIDFEVDLSAPLGQYNYELWLTDLSGNSASDTVIVTIEDTIAPVLYGSYSNDSKTISWVAEDRNPCSYVIYKDGEQVSFGSWISEGEISIVVSPEKRNSLNYTIIVKDTSGNFNTDSVIILPLSQGDNGEVIAFPWLTILMVVVGLAFLATTIILVVLIRKNPIVFQKKNIYTEH